MCPLRAFLILLVYGYFHHDIIFPTSIEFDIMLETIGIKNFVGHSRHCFIRSAPSSALYTRPAAISSNANSKPLLRL